MNKNTAVMLAAVLVVSATMSGLYAAGNANTNDYPELSATTMAADPPHNTTLFLHTGDTARYFSPQLSVVNYYDTYLPTDEGHNYTGQEQFAIQWYMFPQTASELTLSGLDAVMWISGEVGTGQPNMAGSVQIFEVNQSNIEDLNFNGTEIAYYNVPSNTPIYTYPPAAPMVFPMEFNYTFAANSTLRFVLTINPGTSGGGVASQYTNVTVFWDSYHLYDSRLIMNTENPLTIENATALNHDKVAVDGFVGETDMSMYFQANISDPFGGYDIKWVNLTAYDPEGAVVAGLEDVLMERISGTDVSSPCIYELAWNYSGMDVGEYTFVVWAVDNSGWTYFYYFSQYDFAPYDETFVGTFVIGAMYDLMVHLTDTMGLDLVDALATFESQEAYSNETGWAHLTVFGNGTLVVFWHGVSVNETWVDVTNVTELEVVCAVYYPEIVILDSKGEPLPSAAVFFSYPDGEALPATVSDVNGSVGEIDQVPVGESPVSVWWRGALVFNGTVTVDHNGETDVTCEVYYMSVLVTDYGGTVIPMASVAWLDSTSHILIDSRFVNETGWATARLPVGGYDIEVYWYGALVNTTSATLTGNMELEVQCAVSYLTVYAVDSGGSALDGVEVAVFDANGDAIAYGVTADGKVEFWLPDQTYTVQGHLVDEYMMTTVSQYVEEEVAVTYGAEATLTFSDYPPSFVSTTLFSYAILLALVAVLGVALLYFQILKPRKGAKASAPPAEEPKSQ